jgi:4-hydroxy-2-oxoheptanedioate aldolase
MECTTVRQQLRSGQPSIGTWLALDSVLGAEWMAYQGFDWLAVEHTRGPLDQPRTVSLLRAIGTAHAQPLVRVPWKDQRTIAQALGAGAAGLFIPSVETREEAEHCVAAVQSAEPGATAPPGDSPLVVVMLDTALGLRNVREITSVAGIDACFVNSAELCAAIGIERGHEPTDDRYFAAIGQVFDACRAYDVAPGIQVRTPERAVRHLAEGWQLVGIASDGELMARAAANTVAAIRERVNGASKVTSPGRSMLSVADPEHRG